MKVLKHLSGGQIQEKLLARKETESAYLADSLREDKLHKKLYMDISCYNNGFKPYNDGRAWVYVQCSCGTCYWLREDNYKSGHYQSCPLCSNKPKTKPESWKQKRIDKVVHINKIKNDLTGQQFVDLYVDRMLYANEYSHVFYDCICKCGNHRIVRNDHLTRGEIICCKNCMKSASKGEYLVEKWLKDNKIKNYSKQYIFTDLKGDGNKPLKFDFAIIKNNKPIIMIEFQGEQHYENIIHWGGQTAFQQRQAYDNRKRIYCKKHGIKLIEIPYNYESLDHYLAILKNI